MWKNKLTIEIIYDECDFKTTDIRKLVEMAVRNMHEIGDEKYPNVPGPYVLHANAFVTPTI